MHEFTLAQNIIEIVEETAQKNNASRVSKVVLEIGTLSGVELTALDLALECLRPGTILSESEIKKDIIEAIAVCNHCGNEYTPDDFLSICPVCNNFGAEIIKGKELRVKSITAE
jgi:hydrogenase nickel incorporation protein HypA/HybF